MSKTFRPYEPNQLLLMPSGLSDGVPEKHLARFAGELYLKTLLHDVDGDQRATDSDEDR